jgi:D-lactate dehydrogenase
MTPMKVAFFGFQPFDKKFIVPHVDGLEMHFFEETLSDATLQKASGFDALSLFVHDRLLDVHSISYLADLGIKIIALRSAGFNHVNIEACKEHGIRVISVPSYSPASIAEFAVAFLFDAARHITRKSHDVKDRKDFSLSEAYIGFESMYLVCYFLMSLFLKFIRIL